MRDRLQAIQVVNSCLIEQRGGIYGEPNDAANIIDAYETLPVEITDEMVERAFDAALPFAPDTACEDQIWAMVRAVLAAAFGERNSG